MEVIARKGKLINWIIPIGISFGAIVYFTMFLCRMCSDPRGDTSKFLTAFCTVAAFDLLFVCVILLFVVPYFRLPKELIRRNGNILYLYYKKAWVELDLGSIVSLKYYQGSGRYSLLSESKRCGLLVIKTANKTYKISRVDKVAEVWTTLKALPGNNRLVLCTGAGKHLFLSENNITKNSRAHIPQFAPGCSFFIRLFTFYRNDRLKK